MMASSPHTSVPDGGWPHTTREAALRRMAWTQVGPGLVIAISGGLGVAAISWWTWPGLVTGAAVALGATLSTAAVMWRRPSVGGGLLVGYLAMLGAILSIASVASALGSPSGASTLGALIHPAAFVVMLAALFVAGVAFESQRVAAEADGRRGAWRLEACARQPGEPVTTAPRGRDLVVGALRATFQQLGRPGAAAYWALRRALLRRDLLLAWDVQLDSLAEAAREAGASVDFEAGSTRLLSLRPAGHLPPTEVSMWRDAFVPFVHADALRVRGPPDALAAFLSLARGPLAGVGCWSRTSTGRRLERFAQPLLQRQAPATAGDGLATSAADQVERLATLANLAPDEAAVVLGWKLPLARATRRETPAVLPRAAPGWTLEPPLANVLAVGASLAALRDIVLVPHWLVRVQTPWGLSDVVVDAHHGAHDPARSDLILEALAERGATMWLDALREARALEAPRPTAAIMRSVKDAIRRDAQVLWTKGDDIPTVWLPYLPSDGGLVCLTTLTPDPRRLDTARPVASEQDAPNVDARGLDARGLDARGLDDLRAT